MGVHLSNTSSLQIMELEKTMKKSNKINERQNKILIILTIVLVVFTAIMAWKMFHP